MKTIGEIFKQKRLHGNITIADVEKATKIRKTYIEALEGGNYDKLPPAAFTRGFVKNYSEFLGLPASEILALYRREFDEQNDKRLLPKSVSEPIYNGIFSLTPKRITYLSVFLLLFSLVLSRPKSCRGLSFEVEKPIRIPPGQGQNCRGYRLRIRNQFPYLCSFRGSNCHLYRTQRGKNSRFQENSPALRSSLIAGIYRRRFRGKIAHEKWSSGYGFIQ